MAGVPAGPATCAAVELPPGPGAPGWWQLWRFVHNPLVLLDECRDRWGDAFTLNVSGYGRFVMLSDPDTVREVFRGEPASLHSGEANEIFRASLGPSSVLLLDESPHQRQRRVLVPPLKGERMRAFFDAMRDETFDVSSHWKVNMPFAALPDMRKITLRVILRAGLGLESGPEMDAFERKVETMLAGGRQRHALIMMKVVPIERLSTSRWAPFFRRLNDLNDLLFAFIAARRRGEKPPASENVLDDLLAARHEDGAPLSDQEVRDAIFTILIAGHDTTALALAWALVEILPRAKVMTRIQTELRAVAGDLPPNADQLPKLEYLDGAIREALRLRPIAPFVVRLTKRPFTAGGREYPPGVVLCPCSYLVHRRADLYPDPEAFRPERYSERKYGPHEWFPFGGGQRVCLGMSFALYEMKVVLAMLFSRMTLTRPEGARSRPVRIGVVIGPHDGARILVRDSDT